MSTHSDAADVRRTTMVAHAIASDGGLAGVALPRGILHDDPGRTALVFSVLSPLPYLTPIPFG